LQHPEGVFAPAPLSRSDERGDHPLGLVPHQIRGFLATFENITVTGKSYPCCSACSGKVINEYKEKGWDFVRKALDQPGYVEELSGLKEVRESKLIARVNVALISNQVHERAEAALADIDWDEAEENEIL
jgi:ubiquitin-like modifier-activating enzyme ATG7